MTRRAMVFVNGEMHYPHAVKAMLFEEDFLVSVDGGLRKMRSLGLWPHLLVGDMDSISTDDLALIERLGIRIAQFPREKDETDMELALRMLWQEGYHRIRIIAALGGRLDQTLGNIFLLARDELAEFDVRLDDGHDEVFVIRSKGTVEGMPGETVSLLPLSPVVKGVKTHGLRYPLDDETLYFDHTRGISNELIGPHATIHIEHGLLLCIHTRKLPEKIMPLGV